MPIIILDKIKNEEGHIDYDLIYDSKDECYILRRYHMNPIDNKEYALCLVFNRILSLVAKNFFDVKYKFYTKLLVEQEFIKTINWSRICKDIK